jgi:formyl-CoA transferase
MNGALSGVKVLDLSEYIAGPYCGLMLADMGAEVTKVEPPIGDFLRLSNMVAPDESRPFMAVNKGKRSISVDLKTDEGKEIVHRAVRGADVVVANYRPGVAERLGVDYETLSALNPRLIYCRNTAFGPDGPYANKAGYDLIAQAMTGMVSVESLGRGPGTRPNQIMSIAVTDIGAGMFMAYAIACALYQREQTGRGQLIETSMFAAGLAMQHRPVFSIEALDHGLRDEVLSELAEVRAQGGDYDAKLEELYAEGKLRLSLPAGPGNSYYRLFKTADAWVAVACLNNRLRRMVAEAVGVADPRVVQNEFDHDSLSAEETARIEAELEAAFLKRSADEWCAEFDALGVPCGPVALTAELFDDEHVAAQDLIVTLEHPLVGPIRMPNSPLRMSDADTGTRKASPVLGGDTRQVLEELGYGPDEIVRLEATGVVRSSTSSLTSS